MKVQSICFVVCTKFRSNVHFISCSFIQLNLRYLSVSDAYHELPNREHVICSSAARLNSTFDLVCRYSKRHFPQEQRNQHDFASTSHCQVLDITWHRTSGSTQYALSTSDKYSIWENVEGHGADDSQRVSLLRVRNFALNDVARYSCHVTCDYGQGLSRVIRMETDVCLQEDDVNGCEFLHFIPTRTLTLVFLYCYTP